MRYLFHTKWSMRYFGGGSSKAPELAALPDPSPIPIEVDAHKAQEDVRRRLSKAKGRRASTAAGFLTTPPIVSSLALEDKLG